MKSITGVAIALILVACSNSDEDSPAAGCADVAGNYNIKVTPLSGDCPPGDGKDVQITITREGGSYGIATSVTEGACPAELNASTCKLTATCKVTDGNGATVATINHDYTFSGSTFTGTVTGSLRPPIADPACTAVARHEGTRLK